VQRSRLRGFKVALHARCCGTQEQNSPGLLNPVPPDLACVVARGFILFVGRILFFVNDDHSKIFQGSEDGRAGPDHDPRTARANPIPLVVALARSHPTVNERHPIREVRHGETAEQRG